ncbi:MAG: mevalonate kinase, partial [Litorilinea sp.]
IAVPVWQTVATATVTDAAAAHDATGGLVIYARDIDRTFRMTTWDSPRTPDADIPDADTPAAYPTENATEEPLILVARQTLTRLGYTQPPAWHVTLHSQIPMASGLGSGAALCAALAQALWQMARHTDATIPATVPPPVPAQISQIVFAAEQIYHGTPSGIDNTVVSYGAPVWFRKGEPPQIFTPARPIMLAIADSGTPGSTRATVAHVRQLWQANPTRLARIFTEIAVLVEQARHALETGAPARLGPLFNANHTLLQQLEVSTPALDRLVAAARAAGAPGAKLSGGGGGGNMIALVTETSADAVVAALTAAGARRVILTRVGKNVEENGAGAPDRADMPPRPQ